MRNWDNLNKSGQFGPKKRTKFEFVFLWIDFQFYSVSVTSDCDNIIHGEHVEALQQWLMPDI